LRSLSLGVELFLQVTQLGLKPVLLGFVEAQLMP
jgi:hypothetical protein